MYKIKITAEDFHIITDYFLANKRLGGVKYFWEISVPDDEYIQFTKHLEQVDLAGLSFAFVCIERYKGYKLLYGFSNFEVQGTENTALFDFYFRNNDILRFKFADWSLESNYFIIDNETNAHLVLTKECNHLSKEERAEIKKFQKECEAMINTAKV